MRLYTINDIIGAISSRYFDRGRDYQRQDRVLDVEFHEDGRLITGITQGSRRRAYDQHVEIHVEPHGTEIVGSCTCPIGFNCKHVVAILLEGLSRPEGRDLSPGRSFGVDPALGVWLREMEEATQKTSGNDFSPDIRQRLIYVLQSKTTVTGSVTAQVQLYSVRLLKDGRFSTKPTGYNAENIWNRPRAKFLRPTDVSILKRISQSESLSSGLGEQYELSREDGSAVLDHILETGRCHWGSLEGPALALGEIRNAEALWDMGSDGAQRLRIVPEISAAAILPLSPPWYVDTERTICGRLDLGMSEHLASVLASAPAIPFERASVMRSELTKRFSGTSIPLPKELGEPRQSDSSPRPALHLSMGRTTTRESRYFGRSELIEMPIARMSFEYGACRFGASDPRAKATIIENGVLVAVERDRKFEEQAFERLSEFGFELMADLDIYDLGPEERRDLVMMAEDLTLALLEFSRTGIAKLEAEGWEVEVDDDYPLILAEADDEWYANIEVGSGNDWFGFSLGVIVDGEQVNLLPLLVGVLEDLEGPEEISEFLAAPDGDSLYLRLDDERLLPLPMGRAKTVVSALLDLYKANDIDANGNIPINALHASELASVEEDLDSIDLRWTGGNDLLETGRKLRAFERIEEAAVPASFKGALRPYQKLGLNWLQFMREYDFGGILADDMGLGKTVQAIVHVLVEKESRRMDLPCLVVAPTSLMANWRLEVEQFAPTLKVLTLHGPDRKTRFGNIRDHDIILTTYPLLFRDQAVLLSHEYHLVILDEAQVIKNPKAKVAQIARKLPSRYRLCMTGTPMENHLGELWSQFHFLMPGLLGDAKRFRRVFRTPIEKHGNAERRQFLSRRIAPFLLRRTKEGVTKELPSKTQIMEHVELEGKQRDLYETIRLAMHEKVRREVGKKGIGRSHIIILEALLRLRQVCCDPRLLKSETIKQGMPSAKFSRLTEMLPELIEDGRRILLFSQFTRMLSLIEAELTARQIDFVQLTGRTRNRSTVVEKFQAGDVPVFLISLKAGGTGLNLTAADTVIHYDPWWNPAVEEQATDRAHRIGQDKPVFVYKMFTVGTVEEKIFELQERKRALASSVLGMEGDVAFQLSQEDLEVLFAPLSTSSN